jgi:hypothetical protein
MIKYRAWPSAVKIEPIEILRETEKMVVIAAPDSYYYKTGERREFKKTEDYAYFGTWQEARTATVNWWNAEVKMAEAKASNARENRRKAEAMQEPKACQ